MLLKPFAVLRNGEPIQLAPLRRTVQTGITYADVRLDLGLIAEYEEREAAVYVGIGWMDWLAMPNKEKAACVAHYRTQYYIKMHSHDAVVQDSELQSRRAKRQAEAN